VSCRGAVRRSQARFVSPSSLILLVCWHIFCGEGMMMMMMMMTAAENVWDSDLRPEGRVTEMIENCLEFLVECLGAEEREEREWHREEHFCGCGSEATDLRFFLILRGQDLICMVCSGGRRGPLPATLTPRPTRTRPLCGVKSTSTSICWTQRRYENFGFG